MILWIGIAFMVGFAVVMAIRYAVAAACPECRGKIPTGAARCLHCGSEIPASLWVRDPRAFSFARLGLAILAVFVGFFVLSMVIAYFQG